MSDDDDRKIRARESRARAQAVLARSHATLERSKAPAPATPWGSGIVRKSNHQVQLENRLDAYVAGDLGALDGFDEPSLPVVVETRATMPKRPTRMDAQQENMNRWFSESFALHMAEYAAKLAAIGEEFDYIGDAVGIIDANIQKIVEALGGESVITNDDHVRIKQLENIANVVARTRNSVRRQVNDDVQTDLNVMFKDIEKILFSKMESKFKGASRNDQASESRVS
jgi:hypothetical protein